MEKGNTVLKAKLSIKMLTRISILSVISLLLMQLEFPIPIAPDFLKIDLSEVPAVIGTVYMGPVAGVFIILIKNILKLPTSTAYGIGEVFNFIIGVFYIIPFGLIYHRIKSKKGFFIAGIISSIVMIFMACVLNYYMFLPLYAKYYGISVNDYVEIFNQFNSNIDSLYKAVVYIISVFNIIKTSLITLVSFLVYVILKPHIDKHKLL